MTVNKNKKQLLGTLFSALALIILAGCASKPPADTRARFDEGDKADVIVQFNSWDYTYLNKPWVADAGFHREIPADKFETTLKEQGVTQRNLAVVTLGWMSNAKQTQETIEQWTALLKQIQFDRIVFVRATGGKDVSNAILVHDNKRSNNPVIKDIQPTAPPKITATDNWPPMRPINPFGSSF